MSRNAVLLVLSPPDVNDSERRILSGAIRELNEKGVSVKIMQADLKGIVHSVSIPEGPLDKIDRILLYVHRKTDGADSFVEVNPRRDYPLVYAKDASEFSFLLSKARDLQFIESHPTEGDQWRLKIEGWKHVSEIRKDEVVSDQAFVAMWFTKDLETAWSDGFRRALDETGYKPVRIDLKEHNDKICDQIVAEIRKSGLLVADFTGQRAGVYFEAGFAKGLGIPVVWTCRETDIEALHFDTRQYNHIVWKEPSDLREKLVHRIEATFPRKRKLGPGT